MTKAINSKRIDYLEQEVKELKSTIEELQEQLSEEGVGFKEIKWPDDRFEKIWDEHIGCEETSLVVCKECDADKSVACTGYNLRCIAEDYTELQDSLEEAMGCDHDTRYGE